MLSVHLVPAFQDNYIFCASDGAHGIFIVDPGDPAPVIAFLEERQVRPTAILCTHHHGDHVGGNETLASRYQIPVYGPSQRIPALTRALQAGTHEVEGAAMQVIAVPGHTRDHIAYFFENSLFCGDTLFAAGCGRLFEGTPAQMYHSLQRLAALPTHTQVFCAHEYTLGNLAFAAAVEPDNAAIQARRQETSARRARHLPSIPSRLDLELATNPFLRTRIPAVQNAAHRFDPNCDPNDPIAVFAALRRWKDEF
ncbi:MAG: hydroxyacylglutathione hydrolase [Pseudomonadota bacterium]|uniref:hydroxyacylglutathione hydrolase n=1 Tax=Thermithiobacillus tepidarius TaxID=929 RepID=UPI0004265E3D|nr:hydroxyacylglutathione hydrolase [Thermithiobacillus tepidarius]